jgi:hypothetical protein
MQQEQTCKTTIECITVKSLAKHDHVVMLLLILGLTASYLRDGPTTHFENTVKVETPEIAFIVENERSNAKVGGRQDLSTIALLVTTIFRLEDCASCHWLIKHSGTWALSHPNL